MDTLGAAGAFFVALGTGAAAWFVFASRIPFAVLGREAAGRLATAIFPKYYAWQLACAGLGGGFLLAAGHAAAGASALVAAAATLAARAGVLPVMGRRGREHPSWGRLHGLSVLLNLAALLAAALALALVLL